MALTRRGRRWYRGVPDSLQGHQPPGHRLRVPGLIGAALAVLAVALPGLGVLPADATSQAQVQAQINSLATRISVLDEQYNQATIHLQNLEHQIQDSRTASARAQADRSGLVKLASAQAAAMYREGAPNILADFLTSRSLDDFTRKMQIISQVSTWESGIITQLQIADQRAKLTTDTLNEQLSQAQAISATLGKQRSDLRAQLDDEQRLLGQITAAAKAAAAQAAAARAAAARAQLAAFASQAKANLPNLPASGRAATALQLAMDQVGKPYVWAGSGPSTFDCSGLTMFAWRAAGVSLPHSAAGQYDMLPHVSRTQLQPGDLVFFGSPIHHVGMYVGGGMMVHAPETGEDVQVSPIQSDFVGAARPGV